MRVEQAKAIINDCKARGWMQIENRLVTPTEAKQLNLSPEKKPRGERKIRTYDTNDYLNIQNKALHCDQFTRLLEIELGLTVWPEYRFSAEKGYKLDYAIPDLMICVECNGGVWMKGGAHSRPAMIERDNHKSTLLNINGWTLIIASPDDIKKRPGKVIDLIKRAIQTKQQ